MTAGSTAARAAWQRYVAAAVIALAGCFTAASARELPPANTVVLGLNESPYPLLAIADVARADGAPHELAGRLDRLTFVPGTEFQAQALTSSYAPATLVFRFALRERTSAFLERWIVHAPKHIGHMALYESAQAAAPYDVGGMLVPFKQRRLRTLDPAVVIPPHALDGRTLYLAVRVANERRLPRVDTLEHLTAAELSDRTWSSMFVGFFAAFGIASLLLYALAGPRAFLGYAAVMASATAVELVNYGYPWRYVWPAFSVEWRVPNMIATSVYLVAVAGFSRAFLELPRFAPRLDKALVAALCTALVAWGAFVTWPNHGALRTFVTLATDGIFVLILASALVRLRQAASAAGYFTLAFAGVCLGNVVNSAATLGWIPQSFVTDYLFEAGIAWEAVFLAVAIAERLSLQSRERESLTVANKNLETLAALDGLTGIANRRCFDERLADEWRRAARAKQSIAVILVDIDRFKRFNDTFGHLAGDMCLRRVALALQSCALRGGDFCARYGGEEFIAIIPEVDERGARAVAEQMRSTVYELGIPSAGGAERYVTVSLGVAITVPSHGVDAMELVAAADEALYAAKAGGRNFVVTRSFSQAPAPPPREVADAL